jgi:hypothetical protein
MMERVAIYDEAVWFAQHSGWAAELDPGLVQGELDDKEGRLAGYRKVVSEVWLLLIIPGDAPSSWIDIQNSDLSHPFRSGFDTVILLDSLGRNWYRLNTQLSNRGHR